MAALLEFNAHPTRALLLSELLAKGVHNQVCRCVGGWMDGWMWWVG